MRKIIVGMVLAVAALLMMMTACGQAEKEAQESHQFFRLQMKEILLKKETLYLRTRRFNQRAVREIMKICLSTLIFLKKCKSLCRESTDMPH